MTRGYVIRLAVWALLVVGIAAGGIAWFTRTVPARVEEMKAEPPKVAAPAEVDPFPMIAATVTRPLRWVRDGFVFLLEVLFLVGVVRGWVGKPLGIYELIHAERPVVRFVNGLVLGMAVGNCLFVLYAVNQEGVPWPVVEYPTLLAVNPAEGRPGEAVPVHLSGNFLLVTWVPVLLVMGLSKPGKGTPWVGLGLAASVAVGVGLVFAGWYTLNSPVTRDWRSWFDFTPGAADGRIPREGYVMHAVATGFTGLPLALILLQFVAGKLGRSGSPVWVVCLSLWLFNAGYGFVSFHFGGLQFVLLLLLVVVILAANVRHPYKLCLPGLGPEYAAARAGKPKPLGVTVSPVGGARVPLLSAEEVLKGFHTRWAADHPDGSKPKLLIVCSSGGGIRAAVWTAAVLTELEAKMGPAFVRHLRLVTGASGGMVAAALYAGRQVLPMPADRTDAHSLARDSLWPTWQSLFFADAPSVVLPFFKDWDRAFALEASWVRNTSRPGERSPLQATFADMITAERDGTAPSLVFSPLMVEDGRRLLVSNLDLSDLAAETAPSLGEPNGTDVAPHGRISQPAVEFFRLFPDAHRRFALSTAARLSATFPYISPAVNLPTAPARRIVDAGFFDNYGVGLAAGWLLRNRLLVEEHCGGVAVIEVRAFPLEQEKTGLPDTLLNPGGGLLTSVLAGISTPAEALGVIQSAGAYYRNDHLLGVLDDVFNCTERPTFFVRTTLECAGDGSLSWAVSEAGRDEIVRAVGGVQGQIAGLKAWFGGGGS
jgi:predicted acylesterase/phospholipase RssA